MELARDGQYARACKAAVSNGIASASKESLQEMQVKHPSARFPLDAARQTNVPRGMIPSIEEELVRKMLKSFRRGTAAGPSSLRAQHLCDALRSAHGDEFIIHLSRLVNLLCRGEVLQ